MSRGESQELMHYSEEINSHNEKPPLELSEGLSARFELDRYKEYDPEIFEESVSSLTAEFRDRKPQEQRTILLERFHDAKFPGPDSPNTKLFEQFAYRPISVDSADKAAKNSLLLHPDNFNSKIPATDKAIIYGPSVIFDLPPGAHQQEKLGEQDVIASTEFTSCRAVVGRNDQGESLLCHISTRGDDEAIIDKLRQQFGDGELYYIFPEAKFNSDAPDYLQEQQIRKREYYENIAHRFELNPATYQEISSHPKAENEFGIRGTTIAVTETGITAVGYRYGYFNEENPRSTRNPYNGKIFYYESVPQTSLDIPF